MSNDTLDPVADMRPDIEAVVKRWDHYLINPNTDDDCRVPFGFLRNVERYIQFLERKIKDNE